MRTQLADRYMLDTGTTHGLYIVLWFDTDWWNPDQAQVTVTGLPALIARKYSKICAGKPPPLPTDSMSK